MNRGWWARRGQRARLATCCLVGVALLGCDAATDSSPVGITSPPLSDPTAPAPVPSTTIDGLAVPTTTERGQPVETATPPPRTCSTFEPAPDLPLELCDKGDLVQSVQAEIALRLDSRLEADGFFGPATDAAVREYQRQAGLADDGRVGPSTWNALFGSVLAPTGPTLGFAESWYKRPAADAVESLMQQGFVVIDYEVCSGSVDQGLVRQVIGGDGTVYDDRGGVTEAGMQLSIGEVVEVKVSSGSSC